MIVAATYDETFDATCARLERNRNLRGWAAAGIVERFTLCPCALSESAYL